jgi:hypothetical protein
MRVSLDEKRRQGNCRRKYEVRQHLSVYIFLCFGWCLPGKVLQDVAPYLVHQLVTAAARLRFCLWSQLLPWRDWRILLY